MYEGQVVGEHEPGVTEEEIGLEMLGARRKETTSLERAARPRGRAASPRRSSRRRRRRSPRGSTSWQRAGGIIVPVLTAMLAFLIGGLLVLATGHNPIQAYWDIIKGAGLNWLAHPTNTDVANTAAYNFSQTLLQTTTADPDGPRRRVRLPLRDVQHRRQRPVPRRPLRRELDRHLLRAPGEAGPHPARGRRRGRSRARSGPGSPAS